MTSRRKHTPADYSNNPNLGVAGAIAGFLLLTGLIAGALLLYASSNRAARMATPTPVEAAPAMDLTGRTVAVLRERITYLPGIIDQVDDRLERLQIAGARLINLGLGGGTTEDEELLAGLRSTIGLHPFQSEGARDAIRSWLANHSNVDMVVWIAPDRGTATSPDVWVVSAEHVGEAEATYTSREISLRR